MLSLVIPVYNEEKIIPELFNTTINALKQITASFEIICVDDGSQDETLKLLKQYHALDNRFKVLSLSRNFGHQGAYTAGLTFAKGDYIAMMDGDLQDPPELLKEMFSKIKNEDYEIVYGKRIEREEGFVKRIFIKLFHKIFSRLSNFKEAANVGNFSIMTRKALNTLLSLNEKNRYLPGLRFFIGFKQGYVEYIRPDRTVGNGKMGLKKLVNLALDAVFSFSDIPIKLCLYIGIVGVSISFIVGMYVMISKYMGIAMLGWSSTLLSVYFFGFIQMVFLGIIGEYVFRIYKESQNRPIFIVDEFLD
jgi:glycosyltransferase involved in cell wall biosynthesis